MTLSRLHRTLRHPYYVMAPDYTEASGGIQSLHYLCHALNLEGADAYLASARHTQAGLKTPLLTDEILQRHVAAGLQPIAIYPEIVTGNPLGATVCVRYMLNKEGLLNGNRTEAGPDDLHVYYRDEFRDPARPGPLLRLPMIDVTLFSPEPVQPRTVDLLYLNRVPRSAVDFSTLPAGIQVLCLDDPLPLPALADLLRRARVFYSYEASGTCSLAVFCGCPVVARVAPGYERYAITEQGVEDLGGGIAWHDDPASLQAALAQAGHARERYAQVETLFWQQLDTVIADTQQRADRAEAAARRDPMATWLESRRFDAHQHARIAEYLQQHGGGPSLLVLVRDPGGDTDAVAVTLRSLDAAASPFRNLSAHVVGRGAADGARSWTLLGEPVEESVVADAAAGLEAINALVAATPRHWLLLVDAGDCFTPSGLVRVASELAGATALRAVRADLLIRQPGGRLVAAFGPDFNLDMLLSCPSNLDRHWLFRIDDLQAAGGFDPASADAPELDLLTRLIEAGGLEGLGHVHEPLLIVAAPSVATRDGELRVIERHLRQRGYSEAQVVPTHPGRYRIGYGHAGSARVSVVIDARHDLPQLQRCVETLLEKTAHLDYEVLLLDDGRGDAAGADWLAGLAALQSPQLRVIASPERLTLATLAGLAAEQARGDYLLFLDPGSAIVDAQWLDALLNHAQRPEVGIVGAKLVRPGAVVDQAGLVLGLNGAVGPAFAGHGIDAPGYMYRLQIDQDASAVGPSCLMVARALFMELGGLDPDYASSRAYVDLCLRVRQSGHLVVWTPHALVMHAGLEEPAAAIEADDERLLQRWLPLIAQDPAYNRNLSLNGTPFQVQADTRLTWRPLGWRPRPTVLAMVADQYGCGHYRVIQPAEAMQAAGLADAIWSTRYLSPVEMHDLQPDTLVLQRQMFEHNLEPQQRGSRFSRCFKVAELDDYLPNVPRKSLHRDTMPKDILRTMRKALAMVDRFVVSTPALAEALHGMHRDIRVVENRLPVPWWQDRRGLRRQGARPRVGWGGGSGHRGDLELIEDVVKALAGEVEWVFFGMCPDALRPYVHEFHAGVSIEDYPARLAGLNLDLALAPLEDNLFNQCKSNLRLLEYGACGFPVVCSDVRPYQGPLPVTRVRQRYKDWVEAIRMHTQDLDAAAAAGDTLRAAVHRDWMLDEAHAAHWLAQWLPD